MERHYTHQPGNNTSSKEESIGTIQNESMEQIQVSIAKHGSLFSAFFLYTYVIWNELGNLIRCIEQIIMCFFFEYVLIEKLSFL